MIFYRQRPVSRQGRKKNFSGPKKFDFLSPEASQQARKEKKLFRPQKVLFPIARGRSAGKEGKKHFSGPKKVYFLSPEAGQQARKEKKNSGPKKFYFLSPEASQQARKETKLFRHQKVLFSIARGRSAGKEGKKTFQAPKSFIFYRQRPPSWVDGCRSSRMQSCSRRTLHLCDNVRDVTTQAQEAQRPIRLRFKNSCKRPWIVEKNFSEAEKFFSLGLDPGKKAHKLLSSFELTR